MSIPGSSYGLNCQQGLFIHPNKVIGPSSSGRGTEDAIRSLRLSVQRSTVDVTKDFGRFLTGLDAIIYANEQNAFQDSVQDPQGETFKRFKRPRPSRSSSTHLKRSGFAKEVPRVSRGVRAVRVGTKRVCDVGTFGQLGKTRCLGRVSSFPKTSAWNGFRRRRRRRAAAVVGCNVF
uniref:Movement protein n=1 Tax=Steinernema glaseri TaxID=37863 RepID=A0A1I8A0V6_9BILA